MAAPLLSCREIRKNYGSGHVRVSALRGIDLDLHTAEVTMLMGPSGCGKTTLLSILATLLDADSGTLDITSVAPQALSASGRAALRAQKLGFVFQSFNLLPALTAEQNVAVPLLLAGRSKTEARALAAAALDKVGLSDRRGNVPGQLSGGQQQRVAIARAIVHRPSILLCDEPTSALDYDTGREIMETLQQQAQSLAAAVLIVSHDPRICAYADRVLHMEDGQFVTKDKRVVA